MKSGQFLSAIFADDKIALIILRIITNNISIRTRIYHELNSLSTKIHIVIYDETSERRSFQSSRNGCSSLWMCEGMYVYLFPTRNRDVKRCRIYPGLARIRFINVVWINSILPDTNDTVSSKHFFDWRAIESERRFRLLARIFYRLCVEYSQIQLCRNLYAMFIHLFLSITRYLISYGDGRRLQRS